MTAYARGADLFRAATFGMTAYDLDLLVPSCPGWTVSDVITHVADNHEAALAEHGVDTDVADLITAYEEHLVRQPRAVFDALDLTLHAWDVARARGMQGHLDDVVLDFLEAFAADAGDQLYVDGAFERLEPPDDADRATRVLAAYGRAAD